MIILQYAIKRITQMVLVFFVVSAVILLLLVATGDPIELMLPPNATNEQRDEIMQRLGLDKPWYVQYGHFPKVLHAPVRKLLPPERVGRDHRRL